MYKNHTIVILHNYYHEKSPEDIKDIGKQAHWISEILQSKGYDTRLMPFSLENLTLLSVMNKNNPIVVFNLVDSASNEESLAYLSSGLLEYMRIPYTGCTLDNLYITTNKVLTKQLLKEASIPTPWWFYRDENKTLLEESVTRFIIKPIKEDASIGLDEYSVVPSQKVIEILHEKKRSLC